MSELRSLVQDDDGHNSDEDVDEDEEDQQRMVFEGSNEVQPAYERPKEVRVIRPLHAEIRECGGVMV